MVRSSKPRKSLAVTQSSSCTARKRRWRQRSSSCSFTRTSFRAGKERASSVRLPQEGLEARGPRRLRAFGPGSRYIIIWSVRLDSQIFEEALPLLDPKHNLRFEAAVVVAVHGESLMLIRSEKG